MRRGLTHHSMIGNSQDGAPLPGQTVNAKKPLRREGTDKERRTIASIGGCGAKVARVKCNAQL